MVSRSVYGPDAGGSPPLFKTNSILPFWVYNMCYLGDRVKLMRVTLVATSGE